MNADLCVFFLKIILFCNELYFARIFAFWEKVGVHVGATEPVTIQLSAKAYRYRQYLEESYIKDSKTIGTQF